MTCVNFISLIGWLMLGTVSQTMLYYLKQLTLLNHDLINFGNIRKYIEKSIRYPAKVQT